MIKGLRNNMRFRLMSHYAGSFFVMCLIILVINFFYMTSYVYKEGDLYNFDPSPWFELIEAGLSLDNQHEWHLDTSTTKMMAEQEIGLQILNGNLVSLFSHNVPKGAFEAYRPDVLVTLGQSESMTVYVKPMQADKNLTTILFFNPEKVKRTTYTYDVARLDSAYNIYWLIGMNIALLLMFSYMYTYSISRPIQRLINSIMRLAQGDYHRGTHRSGVYASVESAVDTLAENLSAAKRQQEQANKVREEWISNLSHDIKTPLTAIMGYGEIIGDLAYPLTDTERTHYARVIDDKGKYIQGLVNDLNLTVRLKEQSNLLKLQAVNIVSTLKTLLVTYSNDASFGDNENSVSFTYTIDQVDCNLDVNLFSRVVHNLLANAWSHNTGPTHVSVHVGVEVGDAGPIAIITFEDNGSGVAPEELDKIFNRYYRGTHTEANSEGSGLGLAIVREIIHAHGGVIDARNSLEGGLLIRIGLQCLNAEEGHNGK